MITQAVRLFTLGMLLALLVAITAIATPFHPWINLALIFGWLGSGMLSLLLVLATVGE